MANQDWKSITITFVVAALILHYFLAAPIENRAFQISKNHIKYHSNWTSDFSQLQHVNQLQEAYKLDNIESIDLAFSMSSLDFDSIKKVLPTQFKQYKKIKINLANNPIGTAGADHVLSLIPNQVEELEIAFDSIDADQSLGSTIVKRLNNLNSLKKLKVSLILAVKNDSVIDDYFRFGRIGERLQSYSLIFIGNSLTSKSLGYLETHLSRANLKNLELNFYANKLGAEGAQIVAKAIKSQKNLQSLAVDFYFNNITDVGTEAISKAIEEINQPNLKNLLLNLDFNYIKNEGGKAIGTLLPRLTNIESLHLGVASKNFGYLGFKHIVNGLSHLTQLKQLNFRCGVNRVGVNGAEITRDLLFKLKNLVTLNLNFYENYIGDEGVLELIKGVTSLEHLEKLSLNVGFSDAKGYGFIKGLQALVKRTFKQLYLGFSSNEIQDTEVNLIIDELKQIVEKTKVFEFEFMETAISKKQQKRLEKVFENGRLYKNKALIHVNSVISEEQQKKYEQSSAQREQKLKQTENEIKKAEEQKKQQKLEKQVKVEQSADEAIELDQQTETVNQNNKVQEVSEKNIQTVQAEQVKVESVEETVEEAAEQTVEKNVEQNLQVIAEEAVEQIPEQKDQEAVEQTAKESQQQIVEEKTQSVEEATEQNVIVPVEIQEEQIQETPEQTVEEAVQQIQEVATEQNGVVAAVEQPIEQAAQEAVQQIEEVSAEQNVVAAEQSVQQAVEEAAQQISPENTQESTEQTVEEVVQQIEEVVATEQKAQQAAEEAVEEIQEVVAQQNVVVAVEQPLKETNEQVVETPAEIPVEQQAVNKVQQEAVKQPVAQITEEAVAEQTAIQAVESIQNKAVEELPASTEPVEISKQSQNTGSIQTATQNSNEL